MVLQQDYAQGGGKSQLIEGRRKTWKRNFNGTSLNLEVWKVTNNAPGMSAGVSGGVFTVGMGTGINEEYIIQSIEAFTIPFRVQWHHTMSQRIVNQEVYLEMVNAAGDTYVGWMFDGATTTQAKSVHMNGGISIPASPTAAITVTGTATTSVIREIDVRMDAVDLGDRGADSAGVSTTRWTKSRSTLDPEEKYYVRMRFKNLGTAPASNTTVGIESILVQDINDIPVEIAAGRGNNGGNRSLPVTVNGTATVVNYGSTHVTTGTAGTAFRNGGLLNVYGTIKGSAGKLYGISVSNPGATPAWFNIYNSTAPTVGTTTPTLQFLVPAGQTIDFEQGFAGINFSTGMTIAATDTSATLSAVAPGTALIVNAVYV